MIYVYVSVEYYSLHRLYLAERAKKNNQKTNNHLTVSMCTECSNERMSRSEREIINNCKEIENNGYKESWGAYFFRFFLLKHLLQSIFIFLFVIFLLHLLSHRFC